jgi:dihydrofolate reductase
MIGIIAAMTIDRVIGVYDSKNEIGRLPWEDRKSFLAPDLRRFKEITENSTVIMGRKTWESTGCIPLPNRNNIIISRSQNKVEFHNGQGYVIWNNLKEAIQNSVTENVWIIGGSHVYKEALQYADIIDLTVMPILSRHLCKQSAERVIFPVIDESKFNRVDSVHPYSRAMRVIRYVKR